MGPENRKEPAMGSGFISGIFNYCDKWCERCALSSRCMVFRAEAESGRLNNKPQEINEELWREISDMLNTVLENLKKLMKDRGLDHYEDQEIDEEFVRAEELVESHPLTLISETYFKQTHIWLDSNREMIAEKIDGYKSLFEKFPSNNSFIDRALKINDYVEIIGWYHSMIPMKVNRALNGLYYKDDPEEDTVQNDMNGSAKVALKSVERSIVAWKELSDLIDGEESEIYRQLAMLMKIKEGIHQSFPEAEKFIRPGFDQ